MPEIASRVGRWIFPSIVMIFVALYGLGLFNGDAPEIALLRAGAAGIALAVIGRIGLAVLCASPKAAEQAAEEQTGHLDITIGEGGSSAPPSESDYGDFAEFPAVRG